MKIYIAVWQDRHSDTTAHPFITKEEAIAFCRKKASDICRHEEDYEEQDIFEFFVQYSCKGDCLYVTEHNIHGWELVETNED